MCCSSSANCGTGWKRCARPAPKNPESNRPRSSPPRDRRRAAARHYIDGPLYRLTTFCLLGSGWAYVMPPWELSGCSAGSGRFPPMNHHRLLWVAVAGLGVAVALFLWPLRSQQGLWAVTVGSERTEFVPVRGGELVTPLQVLIRGTGPQELVLRAAVNSRARLALAAAVVGGVAGAFDALRRRRLDTT